MRVELIQICERDHCSKPENWLHGVCVPARTSCGEDVNGQNKTSVARPANKNLLLVDSSGRRRRRHRRNQRQVGQQTIKSSRSNQIVNCCAASHCASRSPATWNRARGFLRETPFWLLGRCLLCWPELQLGRWSSESSEISRYRRRKRGQKSIRRAGVHLEPESRASLTS